MNISFFNLSIARLNYLFKESILPSVTDQQKKIFVIVSLAFSLLSLCYVISKICFNPNPLKFKFLNDEKNKEGLPKSPAEVVSQLLLDDYKNKEKSQIPLEEKLNMAKQAGKSLTVLNLAGTNVTSKPRSSTSMLKPSKA